MTNISRKTLPVLLSCTLVALLFCDGALAAPFKRFPVRSMAFSKQQKRTFQCDEVGLCRKGEKRLLLNKKDPQTANALKLALSRGCRLTRTTKEKTGINCPSTVSVPAAQPERVFELNDINSDTQIGAIAVQQSGITGNGVLVAVLDTGVEANHPELLGKVNIIQNFTSSPEADAVGHGTHVSGIIAGQGAQEVSDGTTTTRTLGVSPGAQLIVGKVCNDQGYCLEADINAGIEWAVAQHARVINMSLGGGSFLGHCDTDPLAQEVNWAVDQGVVVVVAAGNSGDSGEGVATPGCASKAIAVGAVDSSNVHPSWSSYGTALDVVAPGVGIISTISCTAMGTCPTPAYGKGSGTSMATPHVTGVVAQLLQAEPRLTPAGVFMVLTTTAKDFGSTGFDSFYGYGEVDAQAAIRLVIGNGSSSSSFSSSSSTAQSSSSFISSSSSSSSSLTSSSSSQTSSSSWSSSWSSSSSSTGTSSSWSSSVSSSSLSSSTSFSSSSLSSSTSSSVSSSSFSSSLSSSSAQSSSSSVSSSTSSNGSASSPRGDRDNDDQNHRNNRSSPEPKPICTVDAWACKEFGQCQRNGWQVRQCILIDFHCREPGRFLPDMMQKCTPPPPPPPENGNHKGDRDDQKGERDRGGKH